MRVRSDCWSTDRHSCRIRSSSGGGTGMEMSHQGEGAGTGAAGYPAVKRGLDVAFSATGIVLLAPLHGLIALLVKASSPGPVLYRQERIGRDCVPFQLLKFRTMRVGAESEGPLVTAQGDTRVT